MLLRVFRPGTLVAGSCVLLASGLATQSLPCGCLRVHGSSAALVYVHARRECWCLGWSQRCFTDERMISLWREIICNFDQLCSTLQVICTPPRHTTPMGLPSFPVPPESKQNKTKQNVTIQSDARQQSPTNSQNPHDLNTHQVKKDI